MWQNSVASALAWNMETMPWIKKRNMMIKKIPPRIYCYLEDVKVNMRIRLYLET